MSNKDPEPFTEVRVWFCDEYCYPCQSDVMMSFGADYEEHAQAFYTWWHEEGAVMFNDYLKRGKP